jgi:transposase
MLEGLRGEESTAELRRRKGVAQSLCCSWSKEFLEAGKKRLPGDRCSSAQTRPALEGRANVRGRWSGHTPGHAR